VVLSVHDVGHRVVLRRVAGERAGRPLYTDVLGELVTWGDTVVVRTADGTDVTVPREAVAAAKRVPPRPARRPDPQAEAPHRAISTLELERIAALGWRGLHTERLGGWLLRAGGGWTGRANSVLPLGDPPGDIDSAVQYVEQWYAAAELTPMIQVPLPTRTDLRDVLLARGWREAWGADVKTASCAEVLAAVPPRPALPAVVFDDEPSKAWLAAYHYRGGALPPVAVEVLRTGDAPTFASVVEGGRVIAVARAALDEGWVGLTAVEVDPAHRRRGLATHLLRAIVADGLSRGASSAYLQVEEGNDAAQALYDRVGFATHHRYQYVRRT
jgi:ribosomal protein S18 acetylase RimI-like enzyme